MGIVTLLDYDLRKLESQTCKRLATHLLSPSVSVLASDDRRLPGGAVRTTPRHIALMLITPPDCSEHPLILTKGKSHLNSRLLTPRR